MKIPALTFLLIFATVAVRAEALPVSRDPAAPSLPVSNDSLIRVNSTNQAFDFFRPWTKKAPFLRRGLGAVLAGGDVLVTAAEKSSADVVVVDYDANLALLRPADPGFLKDAKPLQLDFDARVGDKVSILQFESNGLIADTPGVITTIAVAGYPLDHLGLLTYRISAPLQNREGSFTVPAVRDGRLLGLLMRYDARSQTADVIPAPVISHFLADAKLQSYPGFPRAGLAFTSTRDPQFRRYIGLKEDGGVYVTEVRPGSAAEKAGLRKGDVILAVSDKPVDQDGNYEEPNIGRIPFSHLTNTLAHVGDTVDFTVLRDGKRVTIPLTLGAISDEQSVSDPYKFSSWAGSSFKSSRGRTYKNGAETGPRTRLSAWCILTPSKTSSRRIAEKSYF